MADLFQKLRGVIGNILQIGLSGPQIKNNSGAIEARDSTDAGFAIVRGADPVGNDDLVTKRNVNSAPRLIRFAIDGNAATQDSTAVIPSGSRVLWVDVEITTVFNNNVDITVGTVADTTAFQVAGDNDPKKIGTYTVFQDTDVTPASVVRVSLTNTPSPGAGFVRVWYVEDPLT